MIGVIQEVQKEVCPYCKRNINGSWKSEFDLKHHYKVFNCECGKKVWIKLNFNGSGHDTWDKKSIKIKKASKKGAKIKTIEDKIFLIKNDTKPA